MWSPGRFLDGQLFRFRRLHPDQEIRFTRVASFLSVPLKLEKLICFGYVICFAELLANFTILPLRTCFGLVSKFCLKKSRSSRNVENDTTAPDLAKIFLIGISSVVVSQLDVSRLYHFIRGQSIVKLYVIFNVCEVADKLLSSFGLDILNSYFGPAESCRHPFLVYMVLSTIYLVGHTTVLLYQAITLNVAINSYNNALLTLLISSQFVEIKSAIFKKFDAKTLFQISCLDIVERFHISIFCLVIGFRNTLELAKESHSGLEHVCFNLVLPLVVTICSEAAVDWLKHSFIVKFNDIPSSIYCSFVDSWCETYLVDWNGIPEEIPWKYPLISTDLGLSSLPATCLVIACLANCVVDSSCHPSHRLDRILSVSVHLWSASNASLFICLIHRLSGLKLVLDMSIAKFMVKRVQPHPTMFLDSKRE